MPTCRPPRPRCASRRPTRWPSAARCFRRSRPTGIDAASRQPTATLDTELPPGRAIYSLHTAQVTVAFVPDVFGGTRRQIESAEALAEAQAFQREGVYLTLAANIALAAIQEASLRGQIAATRRLIDIADAAARHPAAAERARARSRCPTCVAQETAVAQARLLLPPLEKQLDQQRNLLATLTGRFPSEAAAGDFRAADPSGCRDGCR